MAGYLKKAAYFRQFFCGMGYAGILFVCYDFGSFSWTGIFSQSVSGSVLLAGRFDGSASRGTPEMFIYHILLCLLSAYRLHCLYAEIR